MKNKLVCASVVTKNCIKEFDLLNYTLSLYHDVKWYLSTDEYSKNYLKDEKNVTCQVNIESDKMSNHWGESKNKLSKESFMNIMKTKAYACMNALNNDEEFVLFLDADIFFVNKIPDEIIELFKNKNISAFLCPHATFNHQNEAHVGFFNAGMYCTNSKNFLKDWIAINEKSVEYNLFCDQKPLEYVYFNYNTFNLPINYDIGFWRMNERNNLHISRLNSLSIDENSEIIFSGLPAICFHVHTFKKLEYVNYGNNMLLRLITILKNSKKDDHKKIVNFIVSKLIKESFE